jgi:hypothetical protein
MNLIDVSRPGLAGAALALAALAACAHHPEPATATTATTAVPPGFTLERTGDVHDFAYFEGGWTTAQRKLVARGVGSDEWEEFPATLCATPYLDGHANVDELYMPTLHRAGLTLRVFDATRRQWSIYWASSATGRLDPVPVVGGFVGPRGEFYALDHDADGRAIKVRYVWTISSPTQARWDQAFSYDDRTWETNWTADFTRADAALVCDRGRPRR